MILDSFLLC